MFTPESATHLEFDQTSQVVTWQDEPTLEFELKEVSYHHENDVIFEDMKINIINSKSFEYSTTYQFAVDRPTYYTIKDSTGKLTEKFVENISKLPEIYEGVYQVDNPTESTIVTFTIKGRSRTISTTTDETTGESTTIYGEWYDDIKTWIDVVETSFSWHCIAIKNAVKAGQAYIDSTNKPEL